MYFLSNLRIFNVISFNAGVNLGTYCVRFCTNVEINSKVFIGLIPFQTIYVLLLQTSKSRKLRAFDAFFCLKNCSRVFFLWQMSSLVFWKHCWKQKSPIWQDLHGPDQNKLISAFDIYVLLAIPVIIAHHKFWIKDSDIRRKGIGWGRSSEEDQDKG